MPIFVASVPARAFGQMVLTSGVSCWIEGNPQLISFVGNSLRRFYAGDWGDTEYHEDRVSNNEAMADCDGGRVLAAYVVPDDLPKPSYDDRIWIVCDGIGKPYAVTTILFPGEY